MFRWMQMGIIRTVRIHHIRRTALTVHILLIRRTIQVVSKRVRRRLLCKDAIVTMTSFLFCLLYNIVQIIML